MGVLKSLLKRVSGLFGNLWSFLALCIVAAVVLRVWVVAGYTIPTCSMEPLLHGAEEGGDKVAVFKPYYALFEPERFDLVAFTVEVPLDNRLLSNGTEEGPVGVIKRIVGLPGETILIRDGDIFFGQDPPGKESGFELPPQVKMAPAADRKRFVLFRKTLDQTESQLIRVYCSGFDSRDASVSMEIFFSDWECRVIKDGSERLAPELKGKSFKIEGDRLVCDAVGR